MQPPPQRDHEEYRQQGRYDDLKHLLRLIQQDRENCEKKIPLMMRLGTLLPPTGLAPVEVNAETKGLHHNQHITFEPLWSLFHHTS
jgi:hypothetical protein